MNTQRRNLWQLEEQLKTGVPPASGEFLIQQARLVATNVAGVVVPNSCHWLVEEAPGQVIPKLVEFLDR
jgi:pimeloyl-ACP methyl ester carboxylesterase